MFCQMLTKNSKLRRLKKKPTSKQNQNETKQEKLQTLVSPAIPEIWKNQLGTSWVSQYYTM